MFSRKPSSQSKRLSYGRSGPPTWLAFLLGIALVFGVYYLWTGFRNFLSTSGFGVVEATEQSVAQDTATAAMIEIQQQINTPLPSATPLPECLDFQVVVDAAVVRERPSTNSTPLDTWKYGEIVCVINREEDSEWYLIDRNPRTRRIENAYMREDVIDAINPTPTPTRTYTPAPTVTDAPTFTPTQTFTPAPTVTPDPNATPTPSATPSATPTSAVQSI